MTDIRVEADIAPVMRKLARARLDQDTALRKSLVRLGDRVAGHLKTQAPRSAKHRGRGKPLADSFATRSFPTSVVVRSYKPYAAIMEVGGTTPAHDIVPRKASVLAFNGVFAKSVHHPGARYAGKHYAANVARKDGPMIVEELARAVMRTFD